jgi:2-polyprenyl-6-methoxyphenol hydroxylase-like FAD-dependent oxidoreductase
LRRHYERMANFPDGLVVIGDAACSFNPIYAQGMSQGASAARILDEILSEKGAATGLSRRFQKRYAKLIDLCWFISTTEEYRDPAVAARRPVWASLANWYLEQIHELTWSNRQAAQRFLEVMHMLRSPVALFEPAIAVRAIAHGVSARAH